ncbi:alpha/beta hydrolase [Rhizobium sp. 16-449-1b]|uniref:alpha/beta fold hydrolase n=1 Tax=Rhizobium sp. 16-449-1b TaxID=2819989 RepID=UPI001FFE1F7A|nr:alpha/beta hydrolase [Rhizobium sp. 16-449-1b]
MKFIPWLAAMLLTAFTIPAHAEFVKLSDDLTIHYQVAGQGNQVILFVPGWTMASDVFEKQMAHFADSKTYKFISYDPRSQGQSTHTSEGNFYEQHGRDLALFIEKLGLKNIVLGGWSCGGFDVLSYVHQFGSNNLKGFIMIDAAPSGLGADNTKDWVWYNQDDHDGFRAYFTQGPLLDREKNNAEFAQWMVKSATPDYMDWITRISNMTSSGVAALLNESSAYQNYRDDLKAMEGKVPLLYVVRDDWKDTMPTWAKANTPSAMQKVMPKHMSFWEDAPLFNGYLDEYLKSIR